MWTGRFNVKSTHPNRHETRDGSRVIATNSSPCTSLSHRATTRATTSAHRCTRPESPADARFNPPDVALLDQHTGVVDRLRQSLLENLRGRETTIVVIQRKKNNVQPTQARAQARESLRAKRHRNENRRGHPGDTGDAFLHSPPTRLEQNHSVTERRDAASASRSPPPQTRPPLLPNNGAEGDVSRCTNYQLHYTSHTIGGDGQHIVTLRYHVTIDYL